MAFRSAALALGLACCALAVSCGGESEPPRSETRAVGVYFLRDEKLAPVRREIDSREEPERAAVTALLEGPTADETADGVTDAIPDGTELLDLSIADGIATVDLAGTFDDGGGSASMQARVAQLVATLTRFPEVERVAFRLDGEPVESIGGEGVVVDPPIGRRAIEAQTPQILIESPLPGETVTSPVRLSGTANVFEATVSIEVKDETGTVILEAFTTATSGTGTRGTFDTTLNVPSGAGTVTIVAFESSAKDGTPLHVRDVQVTVAG